MVTTYDMASGNCISVINESLTSVTDTPEWRRHTISCPGLALQQIQAETSRERSALPQDLVGADIDAFLSRQR